MLGDLITDRLTDRLTDSVVYLPGEGRSGRDDADRRGGRPTEQPLQLGRGGLVPLQLGTQLVRPREQAEAGLLGASDLRGNAREAAERVP